jgi:outer membrane protein assembly factor BamB
VASYDPDTGKRWWIIDGPTDQMVASVVLAGDVFFVTGGYPDHYLWGLPTDRTGKLDEDDVLWEHTRDRDVAYVPSPVAYGEHLYVVSDRGTASCLEARTGKILWQKDMGRRHSASLVAADGHVYFLSDEGECWVVKAAPEYREVAVNRLDAPCNASPAISRGQIFVRTDEHLYAIGKPSSAR